jgi:hypothetical protein
MSARLREVEIAPEAIDRMVLDNSTEDEDAAIFDMIKELAAGRVTGYRIPFYTPETYRIDVGRFRIHYMFKDEKTIWIVFIGAY